MKTIFATRIQICMHHTMKFKKNMASGLLVDRQTSPHANQNIKIRRSKPVIISSLWKSEYHNQTFDQRSTLSSRLFLHRESQFVGTSFRLLDHYLLPVISQVSSIILLVNSTNLSS